QAQQKAMLDATAATATVVQEAVSCIETVRSFSGEEEEEGRHSRAVAETLRLMNQMAVEKALFTLIQRVRVAPEGPQEPSLFAPLLTHPPFPSPQALNLAVQVLVLCHGHQQLRQGTITASSLVTFLLYQAKVGRYVQVRPPPTSPSSTSHPIHPSLVPTALPSHLP
ncbi:TAP2 protein, partial [Urocolius indicus]|nr:TAP2 protein [Urocolius indicus]